MQRLFFCLILWWASTSQAGWIDASGKPIPDTESMRSSGDLGVQILLTTDEARLRKTWENAKSPPTLPVTSSARPGALVSAMLVFHGCMANARGVCDLVADFALEAPDGRRMPAGSGPVWSGKPLPPPLLQLGLASMAVGFDKTDPPGDYRFIANVKDKVSGRSLAVAARLKLAP